jgi:hypothetical protein
VLYLWPYGLLPAAAGSNRVYIVVLFGQRSARYLYYGRNLLALTKYTVLIIVNTKYTVLMFIPNVLEEKNEIGVVERSEFCYL